MAITEDLPNLVRHFEWDTLLGEVTIFRPREIKYSVERRDYRRFYDSLAALRLALDELDSRMRSEAVVCSVCESVVKADPRGDVLDAAGRCDDCQP